jgi:hypothetical protein
MTWNELEQMIDALGTSIGKVDSGKGKWRPIWDQIKTIGAGFKEVRYPSREIRQHAWERFQTLVTKVKDSQSAERREYESRLFISEQRKARILEAARDATPISPITHHIVDIVTLGMESAAKALLGVKTDERLEHLQYCSRRLKEGWALLEESKREMLGKDKSECFQALKNAQDALNAAWQQWKSWQSEQRQHRIEHRREKREQFEGRVRTRIANLNVRRQRLYDVLAHKERHLEELRDKRDTARSDEFRARVAGWIDEELESMSDIKAKLENIERWIDEEKEKLR